MLLSFISTTTIQNSSSDRPLTGSVHRLCSTHLFSFQKADTQRKCSLPHLPSLLLDEQNNISLCSFRDMSLKINPNHFGELIPPLQTHTSLEISSGNMLTDHRYCPLFNIAIFRNNVYSIHLSFQFVLYLAISSCDVMYICRLSLSCCSCPHVWSSTGTSAYRPNPRNLRTPLSGVLR